MVYALKAQRITTRKLPKDRFITCQIHASSNEKEDYAGCLFSLIEIDNKQYSIAQVGHSIINTTAREYFRLNDDEALENFEHALKKTNEILANYTQEGQTDWIGNLNGLIALVYKDEIHLACVGNSHALLIREGKINNITPANNHENDVHPLCTFSNITSGPLEKNDVIILASKNIFTHIPKKELKQLIEINSLEESSLEIGHILSDGKLLDTNAILIETTTKEDIAGDPLSSIPDTIFIDELNNSYSRKIRQFFQKSFLPAYSNLLIKTKKLSISFGHWTKNKGLPKSKKSFDEIATTLSHLSGSIKKSIFSNQKNTPEIKETLLEKNVKINHYGKLNKFKLPSINQLPKMNKFPKLPLYPVLICSLIAILLFSLLIKFRHHKPQVVSKKNATEKNIDLSKYQTKFSLAKSANAPEAINLYEEIIAGLDNKKLTSDQSRLLSETKSKYSTLTKTKIITIPKQTISLPEKNMKIIVNDNNVYVFGKNSIFKSQINASNITLLGQLPTNSGVIIDVAGPNTAKKFILLTDKHKIFEYSIQKNSFTETNSTEPWKPASAIASYANNLYLLDGQANQIWKYTPSKTTGYNKAAAFVINDNLPINTIKKIAVDGNLYGINQNSQISHIQKSSLTDIKYSDFPSQKLLPKNATSLFKNADDTFFIQESNKITLIDKQGKYIEQLNLEQSNISSIYTQTVLRKIWIITEKTLFSYTY